MGRHRDPRFEQLRREEQLAVEAALRVRDRKRRSRELYERVGPQVTRAPGQPDPAAVDDEELAALLRLVRGQISAALRAGRADRALSQRELASALGLSQPVLARLESEMSGSSLAVVVQALAAVGARLMVVEAARPTRMAGEFARDRAGRRLPAHLAPYRLAEPHDWWRGSNDAFRWHDEPRWSYRRRPP